MHPEDQRQLERHLGRLFSESLNLSQPLAMLHLLREKIADGGYQSFHQAEIMDELGKLQHRLGEVNRQMLPVADLLKQKG
ncbi:hypothetical protein [Tunicatimonas pelagia]|uniref:hypothetical protein n=1 Tax=Tunicatimonas pelagia TaxID=931531 RepID=UPI0026654FCB|nr:hypothetical protein [Tunicatimonas pelagia]WKN45302.1 hypothetical protein P0M28_10060 [Tunicatimonas pelagia]WKN45311.1 hypothetical protein P0M28_10105 [Tunicatimonas pelagia]